MYRQAAVALILVLDLTPCMPRWEIATVRPICTRPNLYKSSPGSRSDSSVLLATRGRCDRVAGGWLALSLLVARYSDASPFREAKQTTYFGIFGLSLLSSSPWPSFWSKSNVPRASSRGSRPSSSVLRHFSSTQQQCNALSTDPGSVYLIQCKLADILGIERGMLTT
ncbi:hypothetical protein V8F33_002782 [Rhypophila sp. PSN 637]